MAAQKFLQLVGNAIKEVFSTSTSVPNAILALDATGKIDPTVLPVGLGPEVITAVASEALTAGNLVNLYNASGVLTARKADATTNAKPAHGFVLANVASSGTSSVYLPSQINTAITGLTIGDDLFLATTPGGVTATAPSSSGNIVQPVGKATKTTEMIFEPLRTVEIA